MLVEVRKIVLNALGRHKMVLASDLVPNPDVEYGVYIPLSIVRVSGKAKPTQKEIIDLKNDLVAAGIAPEFILVDRKLQSLESDIRTSLLTSLPDFVRNAFLTLDKGTAEVWIEEKHSLTVEQKTSLENIVGKCLEIQNIENKQVYYVGEQSLASNTEILSLIRKNAPIDISGLNAALTELNFPVPSLDWINRKLDALRKADAIISLPDRSYALTASSLHKLGTRKDRHSPDITRLLALARRGV
ncbi:hypothetical protein EH30_12960 [Erythrobacter sp. JL475]|nr:hypothetical protein EH30_12960 [Erythrobacter sp. JL475]